VTWIVQVWSWKVTGNEVAREVEGNEVVVEVMENEVGRDS
jgi:hypothetical protein